MSKLIEIDKKVLRDIYNNPNPHQKYVSTNFDSILFLVSEKYVTVDARKPYTITLTNKGLRVLKNDSLVFSRKVRSVLLKDVFIPIIISIITTVVVNSLLRL